MERQIQDNFLLEMKIRIEEIRRLDLDESSIEAILGANGMELLGL